jgi:4-oxalocrotonate tautomerase
LLQRILGKNPATTVVTIDEVDFENWGIGGLPVLDYRAAQALKEPPR